LLKLYTALGTIGLACEIVLEEAGADYEVERLNFAEEQQRRPDYLAVNPKSRVPSLVTDRGVITEAPAIMAYVAQTHPAAKLAPMDDPFAFAELQAFNIYLCSWVHPAAAHRHRGYRWADDPAAIKDMRRKAPEVFAEAMGVIEAAYLKGPWVMGDAFTVADPYLYVVSTWLPRDGVDMARFPRISEHFARVAARPATGKVLARLAG
jgi:glutathione S-transferase